MRKMQSTTIVVCSKGIATKTNWNNIGFRHQKTLGDEESHTPIQKRILKELCNLQEAEKLNPQDDEESRRKFVSNFDWKDSMLKQHEIKRIESHLVKFFDIFTRQRFDIEINKELTVKLTPRDDSPAYSQCWFAYHDELNEGHTG